MKKLLNKISCILPSLALTAGILAVNSLCASYYYQAQPPKAMEEYRK